MLSVIKSVLNLKSKSKLVKLKLLWKSCSFHKLCVLKCKFQGFSTFLLVFIISNDVPKIFA